MLLKLIDPLEAFGGVTSLYELWGALIDQVPDGQTRFDTRFGVDISASTWASSFDDYDPTTVICGFGLYTNDCAVECVVTKDRLIYAVAPAEAGTISMFEGMVDLPDYDRFSVIDGGMYLLSPPLSGPGGSYPASLTWGPTGITCEFNGQSFTLSSQPRPPGAGVAGVYLDKYLVGELPLTSEPAVFWVDEYTITGGSGPAVSFFWRDLERTVEEA